MLSSRLRRFNICIFCACSEREYEKKQRLKSHGVLVLRDAFETLLISMLNPQRMSKTGKATSQNGISRSKILRRSRKSPMQSRKMPNIEFLNMGLLRMRMYSYDR